MGCTGSKPEEKPPTELPELDGLIFVFVNSTSGGNMGKKIMQLENDFEFVTKNNKVTNVKIFNLKGNKEEGFSLLKETAAEIKSNKYKCELRVCAAGGDGTVLWVLSELSKKDCLHLPLATIPLGTGNDHARAFGWGASVSNHDVSMKGFKARMSTILEAKSCPLDTWIVDIKLRDSGKVFEVKDSVITETHVGQKVLKKEMINYFSSGADAQIVFEFEQNRTTSQTKNKMEYVKQGLSQVIHRTKTLQKMIESMEDSDANNIKLRKKAKVLAMLNIPSYSAGANIYRAGKGKKARFGPQYVGDKKLECLSIGSTADVAAHIASGKRSFVGIRRVAQCGGYDIKYVEGDVYVQIDGEAYKFQDLESISVTHGYQVQVLRSPKAIAKPYAPGTQVAAAAEPLSTVEEEEDDHDICEDSEDEQEAEEEPVPAGAEEGEEEEIDENNTKTDARETPAEGTPLPQAA